MKPADQIVVCAWCEAEIKHDDAIATHEGDYACCEDHAENLNHEHCHQNPCRECYERAQARAEDAWEHRRDLERGL